MEVSIDEARDEAGPSFFTSLIAGGIAGTSVDVALFPIDTVKVRCTRYWRTNDPLVVELTFRQLSTGDDLILRSTVYQRRSSWRKRERSTFNRQMYR